MAPEVELRALSRSPETTEDFGERLGAELGPGALVALVGELGSGKTTLVRGLGRGLGVRDALVSPTFTRMRELAGRLSLYHFDAWRPGSEALFDEGQELLSGEGVAVVEWADRVAAYLPVPRLELTLLHRGEHERELRARVIAGSPGAGPAARALERALAAALARARGAAGLELLERS